MLKLKSRDRAGFFKKGRRLAISGRSFNSTRLVVTLSVCEAKIAEQVRVVARICTFGMVLTSRTFQQPMVLTLPLCFHYVLSKLHNTWRR